MNEKRRFVRIRPTGLMSRTGKIIVDPKAPVVECNVTDVSAGGACLEIYGRGEIPKKFILLYGGTKKTCKLVWVKGRRVGVLF